MKDVQSSLRATSPLSAVIFAVCAHLCAERPLVYHGNSDYIIHTETPVLHVPGVLLGIYLVTSVKLGDDVADAKTVYRSKLTDGQCKAHARTLL
jgi:hypothetical protein